jgi:hypothetical protein
VKFQLELSDFEPTLYCFNAASLLFILNKILSPATKLPFEVKVILKSPIFTPVVIVPGVALEPPLSLVLAFLF